MKKFLYALALCASLIIITSLYLHVLMSYDELMGLSVSENGELALGIELTDDKRIIVFNADGTEKAEIELEIMGVYKFSYDGEYVTVYPKRTDKVLVYDMSGNIVDSTPMSYDEYKMIEDNSVTKVDGGGIRYEAKSLFGYTKIYRIDGETKSEIYHSNAYDVNFRFVFAAVCYVVTMLLCIYIFRMSRGKYDDKNGK